MSLSKIDKVDVKLSRLKNKIEFIQRQFFHKKFPEDPEKLFVELSKHRKKIDHLHKVNVINDAQYELLFPFSRQTDSKRFDTTLLHLLLTKLCGYPKPSSGFHIVPDPNDNSEIADLIRVKVTRNHISHLARFEKTEKRYREIYKAVKPSLKRLGCSEEDIQGLIPNPIRFKFQRSITTFVGRKNELLKLHDEMKTLKQNNQLALVITALTGKGKSELSKKYFEENRNFYYNNIIWIDARNLETSFQQLGSYLQLNVKNNNGNYKPIEEIITEIHNYLVDDTVLLIFDNNASNNHDSTNPQQPEILKYIPAHENNYTLITSQDQFWGSQFKQLHLEPLSAKEAILLVQNELKLSQVLYDKLDGANPVCTKSPTGSVCDVKVSSGDNKLNDLEEQINEILRILDHHPFAIQQFITYVQETNTPISEYLAILKKCPSFVIPVTGYDAIIAHPSININIERVAKNSTAMFLLNSMCFLKDQVVHRGFFFRTDFPKIDINESLRCLEKRSLIRIYHDQNGNYEKDVITMHFLIQLTVKYEQKKQCTEQSDFNKLLQCFPLNTGEEDKEIFQLPSIAHEEIEFWFDLFLSLYNCEAWHKEEFLRKCSRHALFLTSLCLLKHRIADWMQILREVQELMEDNHIEKKGLLRTILCMSPAPPTIQLTLKYCLVICYSHNGQRVKAHAMIEKLKKQQGDLFGKQNLKYIKYATKSIELDIGNRDKKKSSEEALNELGELSKRVLGDYHPMTLRCVDLLARLKQFSGENEEAVTLYKSLLTFQLYNFYADDHPAVLAIKSNYARVIAKIGKHEEAVKILNDILYNPKTRDDDRNSYRVYMIKCNLAEGMTSIGQLEQALELFQEVLGGLKNFFAENHEMIEYVKNKISELVSTTISTDLTHQTTSRN